jgi:membrane protease YdiL (CAAX protease family)
MPEDDSPSPSAPPTLQEAFEPPPPTPPHPFWNIFLGPDGLRSGWRLLVYLGLGVLFNIALNTVIMWIHPHRVALIWQLLIGEVVNLVSATVPAVLMAKLEMRRFEEYGLPFQRNATWAFCNGALWGLGSLSLLLLMMAAAGVFHFGPVVLDGVRAVKFAIFYAVVFLIVGLFEEFWIRGYSLFTLSKGIGFWPAAALLSVAFGAIHLGNRGETLMGVLAAALIGLFFCLTIRRTGTLWFAVGFHASWDWGQTYLYSVPNSGLSVPGQLMRPTLQGNQWLSGGSVGPEGSVFVFVIIAALFVTFHHLHRQCRYSS